MVFIDVLDIVETLVNILFLLGLMIGSIILFIREQYFYGAIAVIILLLYLMETRLKNIEKTLLKEVQEDKDG